MICDYLLDFEIKLVEPTYTIKVYNQDVLVRTIGAYQVIQADLLKGFLLAMKLAKVDPKKGKLVVESKDKQTYIEAVLSETEKLVIQ